MHCGGGCSVDARLFFSDITAQSKATTNAIYTSALMTQARYYYYYYYYYYYFCCCYGPFTPADLNFIALGLSCTAHIEHRNDVLYTYVRYYYTATTTTITTTTTILLLLTYILFRHVVHLEPTCK